jgi:gliding motility-associated-like protein
VVSVTAGGTPGFTYSLDGSNFQSDPLFDSLAAGTYTITVSDTNGCLAYQGASIGQPFSALSATANSVTPVSCFGDSTGSAVVEPVGGTPDYTYSLNGGSPVTDSTFSNLTFGNYSVVVTDANGCETTTSFLITQSPQLAANTSSTPAICTAQNGTASVTMIGGGGTYSYSWSPSGGTGAIATGLSAGNYTVVITDNLGCSISASTTVTLSTPTLSSSIVASNATCFGYSDGTASLDSIIGGTAPFSYDWSNGNTSATATDLPAGQVTVEVTDVYGCELSLSTTITEPALLVATAGNDTLICQTQAQLNAASGSGLTGSWSADIGIIFSNPASQNTTVSGLNTGDNLLVWTVTDGVCFNSDTVNVTRATADECELQLPTAISPNGDGRNDGFEIKGLWIYPDNVFKVFNRWGNEVYSREDYQNTDWYGQNNDGNPLPDGTYFVIFEVVGKDVRRNTYVDIRR